MRKESTTDPQPEPKFSISLLGESDVSTLRAMLGLFAREFSDPGSYLSNQPCEAYLVKLLTRDTFVAVAATIDGQVIGGLAGYILPKFEQARSELYIYDLAVDEAHRRMGVASGLIERLKEHANERGIYVIYVQADHGDEAAISLYSKLGTREDVLHFDILPAPGAARPGGATDRDTPE